MRECGIWDGSMLAYDSGSVVVAKGIVVDVSGGKGGNFIDSVLAKSTLMSCPFQKSSVPAEAIESTLAHSKERFSLAVFFHVASTSADRSMASYCSCVSGFPGLGFVISLPLLVVSVVAVMVALRIVVWG